MFVSTFIVKISVKKILNDSVEGPIVNYVISYGRCIGFLSHQVVQKLQFNDVSHASAYYALHIRLSYTTRINSYGKMHVIHVLHMEEI